MKSTKPLLLVLIGLTLVIVSVISTTAQDYQDPYYWDSPEDAALFMGLGFTACIGFAIVIFIIAILLAIWVYKDAEKRGSSGALWLIIVLITGILGLIIWLIVRPPIGGKQAPAATAPPSVSTERRCPSCGRVIPDDARVCPYCGKNFES